MKKNDILFGLDEAGLDPLLAKAIEGMLDKGVDPDDIPAKLQELIPDRLPKMGACLLKGLKSSAKTMLADRRAIREGFQKRLRALWGTAFDLLKMLVEAAREAGEEFNRHYRPGAVAERDLVFDALVRLHARACLVASEVLWQMEGGFASGAMARWRTLHEIGVTASFIDAHGSEVAERYLLHHIVETYKAARQYQEHCKVLGCAPLHRNQLRQRYCQ